MLPKTIFTKADQIISRVKLSVVSFFNNERLTCITDNDDFGLDGGPGGHPLPGHLLLLFHDEQRKHKKTKEQ